VPAGPINRYDEALAADHTLAREMVAEVDHPTAGRQKLVASAVHMSRTPPRRPTAAPLLGQHSREVLVEAGLAAAEVDALLASGVIARPD
jgi:crotonobetainyl-CoA:carnitine CoA-transferase CaiB-like acyl-CoA transferase